MIYSKYLVKDTDAFVPYYFPQVEDDLDNLIASMAVLPSEGNAEMLISFCKDHQMQGEWVKANPVLAEMISSRALPVANLEALFAACRTQLTFRRQLEDHITERFRAAAHPATL